MSDLPTSFTFIVDSAHAGSRLDWGVADNVEHCSRSFAASLIRKQKVTVNGVVKKPGYVLKAGEHVTGTIDPPEETNVQAQDIQIDILYEDDEILVVNKAPGMVVHPAPGHAQGTLVNALMHHCSDLAGICGSLRPGIVHRLDKDTSGALVVAKTDLAIHHLSNQFKSRLIRKHYLALVFGVPTMDRGSVELPIGRHPQDRKKMSVNTRTPRTALTFWQVRERYNGASLLELDIRTGRTHQIRVHCTAIGHPLIGDPVYCRRGDRKRLAQLNPDMAILTEAITRQMLHAWKLQFAHPVNGNVLNIEAPLPEDMTELIDRFREQPLQR
ncbi:RluD: ribosomal large subunit pseudouridine synthase D [Desulfosarcina variabilis str. Montpellier]|uniref:RluA family pseudouridine synthase n=1 Tax=Desulfosarcina variabilis TaxID=2300 RepID=UPI003AFAA4F8